MREKSEESSKSLVGLDQEGASLRSANQQQEPEPTDAESYPDASSIAYTCQYCGPGSICHCDEDEDRDYGESANCHRCGGDGFTECNDPIQCTAVHNRFGECRCKSCGGSGDARDMTVW